MPSKPPLPPAPTPRAAPWFRTGAAKLKASPRRLSEVAKRRGDRLGRLVVNGKPLIVFGMPPQPWLTLTPLSPGVDGKGSITFLDADHVGPSPETVPVWAGYFTSVWSKQESNSFENVRPSLQISLTSPAAQNLVEMVVWGNSFASKTEFEVLTQGTATIPVETGKRDEISFLMGNFASVRLAGPWNPQIGESGRWAFYELRVTPLTQG